MGQWTRDGSAIAGRIGFEAAGDVTELWDETINDFRTQQLTVGQTSPFSVDLESLRIAFQIRPGVIERNSFLGALQALMNEAAQTTRWSTESEFEEVEWPVWAHDVARSVHRLEVTLKRPNPNYHGRNKVQNLIEDVDADLVRLVWESQGGLDLDDALILEVIEHA